MNSQNPLNIAFQSSLWQKIANVFFLSYAALAAVLTPFAAPLQLLCLLILSGFVFRALKSPAMPGVSAINYHQGQWLIVNGVGPKTLVDICHCQVWPCLIRLTVKDQLGKKKHILLFNDHCEIDDWRRLSAALRLLPLQSA